MDKGNMKEKEELEETEQQSEMPNFRGLFEGATMTNCTQNFIWGNKTVNVYGNGKQKSDESQDEVKELLKALLEAKTEKDGKTVLLMSSQEQWYAVYRVLNEKLNYPAKMTDFRLAIVKLGMDKGRVPCVYDSLKAASKKVPKLACNVELWQQYKELSDVYQKQCSVAAFLLEAIG